MIYHIDWNDDEGKKLLVLSLIATGDDYDTILAGLLKNELVQKVSQGFIITEKGMNYLSAATWFDDTGDTVKEKKTRAEKKKLERRADDLAKKLMPLWPTGIRRNVGPRGVNASWRGNSKQVAARLSMIPEVLDYSDDQIVQAARLYTCMYETDKTYMKGLLNFILKRDETNFDDGPDSSLLEMLEQAEDVIMQRKTYEKKQKLR